MNKHIIMGRVGYDPELSETSGGTSVVKFTLATNDGYGDREETNWHRVTFFGKPAEIIGQYVTKGSQLLLEGRMKYGQYDKDGTIVYTADFIGDKFEFVGSKSDNASAEETPKKKAPAKKKKPAKKAVVQEDYEDFEDDDEPF